MNRYLFASTVIVASALNTPALACSNNKLDLDWCGNQPKQQTQQAPLNKPQNLGSGPPPGPKLPNTTPTIVRPVDSKGQTQTGVGVKHKF